MRQANPIRHPQPGATTLINRLNEIGFCVLAFRRFFSSLLIRYSLFAIRHSPSLTRADILNSRGPS